MGARRLLAILAHPDDESMALGGTLARYAAEGVETHVICATRGGAGRYGDARGVLSPGALRRIRTAELERASSVLGLTGLHVLDHHDGRLDQADPAEVVQELVGYVRRIRPQVVVTFGPDGLYGHPDHVAISQLATAAVASADDPAYGAPGVAPPHAVSKLYYPAWSAATWRRYQGALKRLFSRVDGVERAAIPWPRWMITTVVDSGVHARTAARAVACHHSQVMGYTRFNRMSLDEQARLWERQEYYRAMSTVNGGRERETDLFAGVVATGATRAA